MIAGCRIQFGVQLPPSEHILQPRQVLPTFCLQLVHIVSQAQSQRDLLPTAISRCAARSRPATRHHNLPGRRTCGSERPPS